MSGLAKGLTEDQVLRRVLEKVCEQVWSQDETAIKEALAQPAPVQEPVPENFIDALRFDVAMRDACEWEKIDMREHAEGNLGIGTNVSPQRTWVPLTDEEVQLYAVQHRRMVNTHYDSVQNTNLITEEFDAPAFYKTIEAALRSKNT